MAAITLASLVALAGCRGPEETAWAPTSPFAENHHSFDVYHEVGLYAVSQASPGASQTTFAITVLYAIGGMLVLSAALWWIHTRRAKLEEGFDPKAPLRDGVSVVFGRIETDDGGPAVVLRVDQVGTEWQHKGSWSHQWKEVRREFHARPFVLRTASGAAVRVEPPTDAQVHGEFTRVERHGYSQRTHVLELGPGAEVHVYGTLAGAQSSASTAYRAAATTPVLTGTTFAPMVISTEQPGATARARARVHRNMGVALAAWLVFVTLVVLQSFTVLTLTGDVVLARAVATREWREWVKPKNQPGYWRYHYELRADAAGTTVSDEVSRQLYQSVREGNIRDVPFLVSTVAPSIHQVGTDPHTGGGRLAIASIAAIAFAILYPIIGLSTRPWYLKKKLQHNGGGRIADGDARTLSTKR